MGNPNRRQSKSTNRSIAPATPTRQRRTANMQADGKEEDVESGAKLAAHVRHIPADHKDWTKDLVEAYFSRPDSINNHAYYQLFGWSTDEYDEAYEHVVRVFDRYTNSTIPPVPHIPRAHVAAARELDVEIVQTNMDLFTPFWERQGSEQDRPEWAVRGLLRQDRQENEPGKGHYPLYTATMNFMSYVKGTMRQGMKDGPENLKVKGTGTPKRSRTASFGSAASNPASTTASLRVGLAKRLKLSETEVVRNKDPIGLGAPRPITPQDIMLHFNRVYIEDGVLMLMFLGSQIVKHVSVDGVPSKISFDALNALHYWRQNTNWRLYALEQGEVMPMNGDAEVNSAVHGAWMLNDQMTRFDFFIANDEDLLRRLPEEWHYPSMYVLRTLAERTFPTAGRSEPNDDLGSRKRAHKEKETDFEMAERLQNEEYDTDEDIQGRGTNEHGGREDDAMSISSKVSGPSESPSASPHQFATKAQLESPRRRSSTPALQQSPADIPVSTPALQSPPAEVPAIEQFQRMVKSNETYTKPPAKVEPSIDISREWEFNDFLSSSPDGPRDTDFATAELDDSDEEVNTVGIKNVHSALDQTNMSPDEWRQICEYFGFDPQELNPTSGIWLPGWNPDSPLKAYQMLGIYFAMRQFGRGHDLVIFNIAMGLGKTCMALAVHCCMQHMMKNHPEWDRPSRGPVRDVITPEEGPYEPPPSFNPELNTQYVTGLRRPRYGHGILLIVCSAGLIDSWYEQFKKFRGVPGTDMNNRTKLIIAHERRDSTALWRETHKGVYWAGDGFIYDPEDMPSEDALLNAGWDARDIATWRSPPNQTDRAFNERKHGMPMKCLLEPDKRGGSEPWHSEWVMIVSTTMAEKYINHKSPDHDGWAWRAPKLGTPKYNDRMAKEPWKLVVGLVVFDEFHENKSLETRPWKSLGMLGGNQQYLLLSATPYLYPTQLSSPWIMALAKYYMRVSGTTAQDLFNISPVDCANKRGIRPRDYLSEAQVARIEEQSYIKMNTHCVAIDKYMQAKPITTAKAGAHRFKPMGAQIERFLELLRPRIQSHMITYTSDFKWQPDTNELAVAAVDIPPHSTFDVRVPVNKKDDKALGDAWDRDLPYSLMKPKAVPRGADSPEGLFGLIGRYTVFTLFPCLIDLMAQDAELAEALGRVRDVEVKALRKTPSEAVGRIVPDLVKSNAMQTLFEMIENVHAQKGVHSYNRKVIIGCHKPMNVYLTELALLAWKPELKKEMEVWDDITPPNRQLAINKLVSVKGDGSQAPENPWLVLAKVSQCKTGVSIASADCMIILDFVWHADDTKQFLGRVQRNRAVQKSPFTKGFRMICLSDRNPLTGWMADRNATQSEITRKLQAETVEKELGDKTTKKNSGDKTTQENSGDDQGDVFAQEDFV